MALYNSPVAIATRDYGLWNGSGGFKDGLARLVGVGAEKPRLRPFLRLSMSEASSSFNAFIIQFTAVKP